MFFMWQHNSVKAAAKKIERTVYLAFYLTQNIF